MRRGSTRCVYHMVEGKDKGRVGAVKTVERD